MSLKKTGFQVNYNLGMLEKGKSILERKKKGFQQQQKSLKLYDPQYKLILSLEEKLMILCVILLLW